MEMRELGHSGLMVSPICFGANVFGWTVDEPTSFNLIDAVVEAGLNFIDTAEVYSKWVLGHQGGESEAIIGRWLARGGPRQSIVLATKVGADMGDGRKGLSPRRISEAVEGSLRRLQTDYIDLYQAHSDDVETPLDESLEAFSRLIQAGKVRALGASNYSAVRLKEAVHVSHRDGIPAFQSLQPLYNLMERDGFESQLAAVCLDQNIGVIPYYALASGFLTGKYRSKADLAGRPRGSRVEPYLTAKGLRVLQALDEVSERYACQPASAALAWLMQQSAVTAPIVSATSLEQLAPIVEAARFRLDSDALDRLTEASS